MNLFEGFSAPKPKEEKGPLMNGAGEVIWEAQGKDAAKEIVHRENWPQINERKEIPQQGEGGIDFMSVDREQLINEFQAEMANLENGLVDNAGVQDEDAIKYEGGIDFRPGEVTVEGISNDKLENPLSNKEVSRMDWDEREAA